VSGVLVEAQCSRCVCSGRPSLPLDNFRVEQSTPSTPRPQIRPWPLISGFYALSKMEGDLDGHVTLNVFAIFSLLSEANEMLFIHTETSIHTVKNV